MVVKPNNRDINDGPPPVDESWWEAVLAEDEAGTVSLPAKKSAQASPVVHTPQRETVASPVIDWEKAKKCYDHDMVVSLQVTGYNRGGLLVGGDGLQGFVPISHLVETPDNEDEPDIWLERYLEQALTLKVIECDADHGRVVFSERAALAGPGSRNQLLTRLRPGDCVCGLVTNITDFGVFVDLGGVEGLVHVSEISWGRVHHPTDVVELGQQVEVFVIQVDQQRARVALSLKRLHPNPWETAEQRYRPGMITDAVITSLVTFGAFARLEEGLDGLIHVSEMLQESRSSRVNVRPEDIVEEGQHVRVRVLHVDGSKQRLGLSMRLEADK